MGWKISGPTVVWVVAIVAGFLLVRQELRERLIATLQNPENYAGFPLSETPEFDFDKPLDFTMTEPIFPEGTFYRPNED